jgi:hypothetical protein
MAPSLKARRNRNKDEESRIALDMFPLKRIFRIPNLFLHEIFIKIFQIYERIGNVFIHTCRYV